jgi:hypothetical protein
MKSEKIKLSLNSHTGDETWIHCYDPGTTQHILTTAKESEACQVVHQEHVGNVYQEFVPPGQTINKHYCMEVSQHLTEQVCQKPPNNCETKTG